MSRNPRRNARLNELSEAAERVLQKDHPNPERLGCPDKSIIQNLANFSSGEPPCDEMTLNHILNQCYPCYRELCVLRAKQRR